MADFDNSESILTNDQNDHLDHHHVSTFSEKIAKTFVNRNQNIVPLHRQNENGNITAAREKRISHVH